MGQTTFPSPNPLVTPNVTNASVTVASANPQRASLYAFNTSAVNTIWVCPSTITAVVSGAGSVAIQPLQGIPFPGWTMGMNAIASAAGTNALTLLEYYD